MRLFFKRFLALAFLTLFTGMISAQITGKFGTYYDQRELLFESLPTSPSDIIFLGNSITDFGAWDELFQNPHCKNRGISGDICEGVLNRLETVTKGQPAMIFLLIGTNDMNWGFSNDSIALGVRTIVQRIKTESPETRIIVQSILPVNDCYGMFSGHTKRWQDVALINDLLKTMTEEEGVDYLDLYRHFATEEGKLNPNYSNDGLHLNGDGYALWKQIIEESYGTFPRPVYKSGKVSLWLNLGSGLSIVHGFDQGASPLPYAGIGINANTSASLLWKKSYILLKFRELGNYAVSSALSETFDFGIAMEPEYLYRFHDAGDLHWWAGTAFPLYVQVNYAPQLMNAALGYSIFSTCNAEGMIQYDFSTYDGAHKLFTAYAKMSLPLFGVAGRPGFAYIDNYTESLNTAETLSNHRKSFFIFVPGITSDIGLYVNLLNNNKIGVSYRWDYLSTRHKGTYRFDHATHCFNVTYMFNIF